MNNDFAKGLAQISEISTSWEVSVLSACFPKIIEQDKIPNF